MFPKLIIEPSANTLTHGELFRICPGGDGEAEGTIFSPSLFSIASADPLVTSGGLCGLRKGAEEGILAVPRLLNAIPTFQQTHSLEDFSYSFLYLIAASGKLNVGLASFCSPNTFPQGDAVRCG